MLFLDGRLLVSGSVRVHRPRNETEGKVPTREKTPNTGSKTIPRPEIVALKPNRDVVFSISYSLYLFLQALRRVSGAAGR